MNCQKCGKEVSSTTKFCDACGAEVTSSDGKKKRVKFKDLPKKQKITRIVVGCVFLILAAVLIFGDALGAVSRVGDESNAYIDVVKEGALYDYPDQAIGKAFEDFFSDPEWKSFMSDDERIIVEFNGGCTFDGEPVDCCIQFEVYEDSTFETFYAEIDGESLNLFDINTMYETIFEY
ncbi:MAG: zinc-ribbon domain-containing protein [Clostridia bacterium]|nr:zinc-ribbon domain-containing protein [Clostridia bacterium]